jgi:hypothetical protein
VAPDTTARRLSPGNFGLGLAVEREDEVVVPADDEQRRRVGSLEPSLG